MPPAAAATDENDIGRVVARAVNDPRTANKKLVIEANTFTQNELIATWERLSGIIITKQPVSAEELDAQIKGVYPIPCSFPKLAVSHPTV